jgi:polyisoprenyl-phosphate glycosyltransferase
MNLAPVLAPRTRPMLSAVAPCYNEAKGLPELYRELTAACRAAVGESYELILVNDGSTDGTHDILLGLAAADAHVAVINLARNFGQQSALTAGLEHCRGERILIIDADLQDPPSLLPQMMALMDQGAEVVYGQRRSRRGESLFKKTATWLFYRQLRRLIDIDIPLDAGNFRLISRRVLDILNAMPEQHRFLPGLVSWVGLKQVPLVYDRAPRFAGKSHLPFGKLLALALDGITGFSILPLRIASYFGLATGVVGLAMLAYSIGSWLLSLAPPGWTSETTIILVMGSAQLMVLGIVGEYIGRLYMESKRRPIYLIDRIVQQEATEGAEGPKHEAPVTVPERT